LFQTKLKNMNWTDPNYFSSVPKLLVMVRIFCSILFSNSVRFFVFLLTPICKCLSTLTQIFFFVTTLNWVYSPLFSSKFFISYICLSIFNFNFGLSSCVCLVLHTCNKSQQFCIHHKTKLALFIFSIFFTFIKVEV